MMLSESSQTQKDTGCYPTEGKRPEQVDSPSQSGFLVIRGRGGEGMINKGVRDIFREREVFQTRAVVTAAQLSIVSPRSLVQLVRASRSGQRADRRYLG